MADEQDEIIFQAPEMKKLDYFQHPDAARVQQQMLQQMPIAQVHISKAIQTLHLDFNDVIHFAFRRLRADIANRPLYVLFEKQLRCDPMTDHVTAKSVLPLFDKFIQSADRLVRNIVFSDVEQLFKGCVHQCLMHEVDARIFAEQQLSLAKQKLFDKQAQLDANGNSLISLMEQLERAKSQQQKIIALIKEQGDIRKKLGAIYRPDFGDGAWTGEAPDIQKTGNAQFDALLANLRNQIQDLLKQIKQLEKENDSLNNKLKQIPELQNVITSLQARILQLEQMLRGYDEDRSKQLDELLRMLEQLRDENNQLKLENNQLQKEAEKTSDYDDLLRQLQELKDKLAQALSELAKEQDKNQKLERQLSRITKENENLRERLTEELLRSQQLQDEADQMRKQLLAEGEGSINANKKLKTQVETLERDLDKERNKNEQLQKQISQLSEQLQKQQIIFQRATDYIECFTGYVVDSNLPNLDQFIIQKQLQQKTIDKCVYLYLKQPDSAETEIQTELSAVNSDLFRNSQLSSDQRADGKTRNQTRNPNETNLNISALNQSGKLSSSTTDGNRKFDKNAKNLAHAGEDDDLETARRFGQLQNELDEALRLLELARGAGLASLDGHADFCCQAPLDLTSGGNHGSSDCSRDAKTQRSRARVNDILGLSRFTWDSQLPPTGDVPDVFARLHALHARLMAKREMLADQYYQYCREFAMRIQSARSIPDQGTVGLSTKTKLLGQSMFRVQNVQNQKLHKIVDIEGGSQHMNNQLPILQSQGLQKIQSRNEVYNKFLNSLTQVGTQFVERPKSSVMSSRISDAELMEAFFSLV